MSQEQISFGEIWLKAKEEATKAYEQASPNPMHVIDGNEKIWRVPEGLCGFAWIWIPNGRDPFVNWLKKNGKGRKNWSKGYDIWTSELCRDSSQSVERKEAAMEAAEKVLRDNGIIAYAQSRLD